jgi:hypothetical protein
MAAINRIYVAIVLTMICKQRLDQLDFGGVVGGALADGDG